MICLAKAEDGEASFNGVSFRDAHTPSNALLWLHWFTKDGDRESVPARACTRCRTVYVPKFEAPDV